MEGAAPAHSEDAGNRAERSEVVGRRLGDPGLNIRVGVDGGHDDRVCEVVEAAELSFEREAPGTGMDDLDAHEALLARLHEEPADLPSAHAEGEPDLVLRLACFVVEFGCFHGEDLVAVIHRGWLLSHDAPPSA